MHRNEYEKRYVKAGLEQLKPYLLSDELFWNLSLARPEGRPPYPQLTLGNLLLAAHVLRCLDGQTGELKRMDEERREWASAWSAKAAREYAYRLKQWTRSADDFAGSQSISPSALATDIRNRALLELLGEELEADERAGLGGPESVDRRLRSLTQSGEFLWDAELESCFSRERFWFLYQRPR